ncbi:hypothetical protein DLM75_19495 [Leptospira stimsonii]|uniref:Uncharacterized protein n=1 Tax=Leptospira stimsonii TaxID=2202203 RepID=A0A396YWE4_9LEPT|nr:hypothetical protein DLM75_19495 [Leptospira stimsonii]
MNFKNRLNFFFVQNFLCKLLFLFPFQNDSSSEIVLIPRVFSNKFHSDSFLFILKGVIGKKKPKF